ncbi:MAG: hypothetical protein MUC78_13545 [Bacteroidales bacterium]|jgi:hypothetical protein|nr:hypothetical protein [Bacteroidales bacterium]
MKARLIFLACIGMVTLSVAAQVTTYKFPVGIRVSDKYEISVVQDGKSYNSFVHYSECPEQTNPREKILPMLYDRTMSWTNFSFSGNSVEVIVRKKYGEPARDILILPRRYGARINWFDGDAVSFFLDKPEYVSVNFICEENSDEYDQIRHGLMIFADTPETDKPDPDGKDVVKYSADADLINAKTIYFGAGVYDLTRELPNGMLPLHDNQEVYIDGEAYIYGGIKAAGSYNVKVYGRGILCGARQPFHYPGLPQLLELEPWNYRTNVHRGGYATVTGITLLESFNHNMAIPPYSYVRDLKIMGWKVNNDGIRPGDHCVIDNVFFKVSDDHLYAFGKTLITNSLFWPMWNGAILQVSWGDYGGGGCRFVNNDIINAEWNQVWRNNGLLASMAAPNSRTEDILIQDLHVEGDLNAIANLHFNPDAKGRYEPYGYLRNITYRNVEVTGRQISNNGHKTWYDEIPDTLEFDISPKDAVRGSRSYIGGYKAEDGGKALVSNVVFENVKINGIVLTEQNHRDFFKVDTATTSGISFISTGNSDNKLSYRAGFARSDDYDRDEIGAGALNQGFEKPHDPHNSGWLFQGEEISWLIDLPSEGKYDIKISAAVDLSAAQFQILFPGGKSDVFTCEPIGDNGYNLHKKVTQSPVTLRKGMNKLTLKVLKGATVPDYIEVTPHNGIIPIVDVKVTSVSVMNIKGDSWIGAGLNIGVVADELRFNSRRGVVINSDERGPVQPLPVNKVVIFKRDGDNYISVESEELVRRIDLSRLPFGPLIVLFTDQKSFWIAKQIIK